nr:immunoglobulin light chain junction region [Macaca mulatta]MOX33331.1 immunoglobulin light chain junction region [Macaca mulatta]MOX33508.1 immunoglobulin light chain junction region [Macaca mulatta]MOX33648.1 immunoglobulin light chain junction region [Macaca mulatta]MOX34568.1 immunoglobulin light chain junction region [Macaca mulatta]
DYYCASWDSRGTRGLF